MPGCTIVILGATGDLTRRKLIPAIYKLIEDKKVERFAVVGVSIVDTTAEQVLEASKKFIPQIDPKIWKKIESKFSYNLLDFYNDDHYPTLKDVLSKVEKKHKLPGNRLFYLATMPEHFAVITDKLAQYGIAHKHVTAKREQKKSKRPWSRVIYEKPFGQDLASAKKINKAIAKVFAEDQAFRIDHYLGKELVGNIAIVRFTNLFLQPLWNRKYINSVQIILSEKIGVEGRGIYYDQYGALKDVVQNHALQMLALVAMESPWQLAGEHIRDAKVKVLKKVILDDLILGQCDAYLREVGVPEGSKTETFAALRLHINNRRWKGVPFFIKTGKYLDTYETSIHIEFKHPECLLAQGCPTEPNYLTIRVQPDEGFFLELNAKVPDKAYQITPVKMDFCHSCIFGPNTAGAYEVLMVDAIRGDHSVFVRFDEIELSWKIIDQIKKQKMPAYSYKEGDAGPKQLEMFSKKHGVIWRI
jgi:glucose-6-phosphate 1-dehydrogenase